MADAAAIDAEAKKRAKRERLEAWRREQAKKNVRHRGTMMHRPRRPRLVIPLRLQQESLPQR